MPGQCSNAILYTWSYIAPQPRAGHRVPKTLKAEVTESATSATSYSGILLQRCRNPILQCSINQFRPVLYSGYPGMCHQAYHSTLTVRNIYQGVSIYTIKTQVDVVFIIQHPWRIWSVVPYLNFSSCLCSSTYLAPLTLLSPTERFQGGGRGYCFGVLRPSEAFPSVYLSATLFCLDAYLGKSYCALLLSNIHRRQINFLSGCISW